MASSSSPLCSLPFDLVYIILSFADWRDILSIGQTNRRYHHIAHSLPVWIKAAQSLSRKYRIPRNTFSIEGYGVEQLQKLVARPELIIHSSLSGLVSHGEENENGRENRDGQETRQEAELEPESEPEAAFVLVEEKECRLPDSMWVHTAAMVPGGRWLITGHTLGQLRLWDLDAPLEPNGRFKLVHSACLPGSVGLLGVLLIQRNIDCNGVVVLAESREQDEEKAYNLGVVEFILEGTESRSSPKCQKWGAFSGNDTIALEGQYVAAEHQGTTRIWDWKRGLYASYLWDLSLHPNDHLDEGERIDITLRPPYLYLIHSRFRVFAAFRIPEMQTHDVFAEHPWDNLEDGNHPDVRFIRPEIVMDLSVSYSIYRALEDVRPEGERLSYEELRISNIMGVQFINPWTLQHDSSPSSLSPMAPRREQENTIPFFVTVSNSDGSKACLLRYDVVQSCAWGGSVNRPVLKQCIELPHPLLDIISPSVVSDGFGTVWSTAGGLWYVPDVYREPIGERSVPSYSPTTTSPSAPSSTVHSGAPADPRAGEHSSPEGAPSASASASTAASTSAAAASGGPLDARFAIPVRTVISENMSHTQRHRVGFDMISGRKFKVLRSTVCVSQYVGRAQGARTAPLSLSLPGSAGGGGVDVQMDGVVEAVIVNAQVPNVLQAPA